MYREALVNFKRLSKDVVILLVFVVFLSDVLQVVCLMKR